MGCGIKRLFDEKAFCAYGPYRYDINGLIAWDRAHKDEVYPQEERPAS